MTLAEQLLKLWRAQKGTISLGHLIDKLDPRARKVTSAKGTSTHIFSDGSAVISYGRGKNHKLEVSK